MCDWLTGDNSSIPFEITEGSDFENLSGIFGCNGSSTMTQPSGELPAAKVSLSSFPEYIASQILYQSNLWVFWVVGVLGNTASILTLHQMKPFSSVFVYIGCLAVSDIIYLTVKLVYEQMRGNLGYLGFFGCSPLLYVLHWTGKTSHWIILFMTADRLIAIWCPFKVSQISTKKNVFLAMLGLVIFQAAVNCHYLFSNEQTTRGGRITCGTRPEYRDFRTKTLWLFFTLSSIIPCGGVLVMNAFMTVKLCMAAKTKLRIRADNQKAKDPLRHTRRVTIMLMTVSLVFVVLVTPGPVFYLYVTYWNYRSSVKETAIYYLTREIVNTLINADHAINFFLYFLSGTKFRQSFFSLFRCGRHAKPGEDLTTHRTKTTETAGGTSTSDFNKM